MDVAFDCHYDSLEEMPVSEISEYISRFFSPNRWDSIELLLVESALNTVSLILEVRQCFPVFQQGTNWQ